MNNSVNHRAAEWLTRILEALGATAPYFGLKDSVDFVAELSRAVFTNMPFMETQLNMCVDLVQSDLE